MREQVYKMSVSNIRVEVIFLDEGFRMQRATSGDVLSHIRHIHRHSTHEIFFVLDGTLAVATERGISKYENSAVIIPPDYDHYTVSEVSDNVSAGYILPNLPAGTYDITAYAYSEATDCVLYANDDAVAVTTSGLYTVTVKLEEGADLKFGVSWSDSGDKWTCMDEFTLVYYGTESSKISTDIEGVESSAVTPVAIYTVSGAQVDALQKGINIVKYSDGSTKKVLVK